MADENISDVSEEIGPQFRVLTQYVKDLSFENPNAPQSLGPIADQPQIDVRVDVGVGRLSDTDYEVKLSIGIDAKAKQGIMFVVELEYCGLFRLANIPADNIEPILLIECPRQIFPFVRRVIADVTRDGGFPPLMIDPIDFVGLYQQRRAEGRPTGMPAGTVPN
ncbi:MAG: protein-export chaperone SecB [Pseudomonadota bacterium]